MAYFIDYIYSLCPHKAVFAGRGLSVASKSSSARARASFCSLKSHSEALPLKESLALSGWQKVSRGISAGPPERGCYGVHYLE